MDQYEKDLSSDAICNRKVYDVGAACNNQCYVIAVTVNMGFYDFFLNWYYFYEHSVLSHIFTSDEDVVHPLLVVIAEDYEVYNMLQTLTLNNTRILLGETSHVNGQAENYDSSGYKTLVSGRATHLLNLMCGLHSNQANMGLEFFPKWVVVYSDIDTVWLHDPLPVINNKLFDTTQNHESQNHSLQYDILAAVDDHNFENFETYYCTGFLVIADTSTSYIFLSQWEDELQKSPQLNQPIFNLLLHTSHPEYTLRHSGLDEVQFPSGRSFFDNDNKSQVLEQTKVVHNNYIIGKNSKKKRFEEYGIWKT